MDEAHTDVRVIALFYSALHLVEAVLASRGVEPSRFHSLRDDELKKRFAEIFRHYKHLKNAAETARYDATVASFDSAAVDRLFGHFDAIDKWAAKILKTVPIIKAEVPLVTVPPGPIAVEASGSSRTTSSTPSA